MARNWITQYKGALYPARTLQRGEETHFANVRLVGHPGYGNVYKVASVSGGVATKMYREDDCLQCLSLELSAKGVEAAVSGKDPEDLPGSQRNNFIHTPYTENERLRESIMDVGAAIVFIANGHSIGEMSGLAQVTEESDSLVSPDRDISARLFRRTGGVDALALVAYTHLRPDTATFIACKVPSMLDAESLLRVLRPGENLPHTSDYVDMSMFRTAESEERFVGQLLASSAVSGVYGK